MADRVRAGLASVLADSGCDPSAVLGAGIGVPGAVEGDGAQAVVYAQAYGWDAVPLGRLLAPAGDFPLYIDNGAKMMGQAEMWFGAARGRRQAVVCLMGPAWARASSAERQDWAERRPRSSGGTPPWRWADGPCRCGSRGCLEAYVGAEAILERYGRPAADGDFGQDEEAALAALVAATDERAAEVLAETALYLGAGISDLVNLFGPERIVLGGWAGLLLGRADPARRPRGGQAAVADAPVRAYLHRAGRAWPRRGRAGCRDAADGALPQRRARHTLPRPGRGLAALTVFYGFLRLYCVSAGLPGARHQITF